MDGLTLKRELQYLLQESSSSTFLNDRATYSYLNDAVIATAGRILSPTALATITTVAGQSSYGLPKDFMELYMRDVNNALVISYTPSGSTTPSWPRFDTYEHVYLAHRTSTVTIPDTFSVIEDSLPSRLSSSAGSTSTAVNGETTLNDAGASFVTTATAGDTVHDVTDGSSGVIVAVTSNTAVVTALFDGVNNYWTSGDSYFITPQSRYDLILDPPPTNSGDTVIVPYIQRPSPVFSPYRAYNLPQDYKEAVVAYAAWKYKYRDREPKLGDPWYQLWDMRTRERNRRLDTVKQRKRLFINFTKTAGRDRSIR